VEFAAMVTVNLLLNAVVTGILLGGFYAAVSIGITIAFGMLDIVNIAHPVFIVMGSFVAYIINRLFGVDPILTVMLASPLFFLLGAAIFRFYYAAFESSGKGSLRGLAFFFGILFVIEVTLLLAFGVDYRLVQTAYIGPNVGFEQIDLPLRMVIPFVGSIILICGLHVFFSRTFVGRAIMAVAQDEFALGLMAVDSVAIRQFAFGIAIATAAIAGGFLIVIQPVDASLGREYIGRVFAICVLGGMGSISGTVIAALILGVAETITSTLFGASWAPAVSFAALLLTLAIRPSGIMGR
jgi:branched-chain amino acid transport system permease protein